MKLKNIFTFLLSVFLGSALSAQSIASLELGTTSYTAVTTGAATFTSKDANLTSFPSLTLTAGQQGQAGGTGYVSSKNWFTTTQNTSNYWTFTLTAAAGYSIAVTSISIKGTRSGTGITDAALRSDADSYGANIGTQSGLQNNSSVINFTGLTLTGLSSVTFRVYGWETAGGAAGGTWRIGDGATGSLDIDVQGSVTTSCTLPTVQASGISLSSITQNQLTVNWSGNGNGTGGVIVLAKASSAVSSSPASGTSYTSNSTFGSGSLIGTGNYVVYSGTGSSVTVTGLSAQTNYYFAIYTFNSSGPCYMTSSAPTSNNYTLSNPPTGHTGSFTATTSTCSDIALSWTAATYPASGATTKGYMILMRSDGTNPDATGVVNGTAPASLTLPSGTTLAGTATSTSLTVTGLSSVTTYNFCIIPYCWDGSNGATYDYYTAASIPVSNAATTTATASYYYRSKVTGNWNSASTWEASPTGSGGWINACTAPTSSAAAVQVQSGHTVTINASITAPNLTIDGTLIFENVTTARTVAVTDYVIVSSGASFTVQTSQTATHTMTIGGNLTNNGTFDMTGGSTTRLCNVTFNKNGNQNVSGTGSLTRFNYIKVNLGTSRNNILDISTSNFNAHANFLHSGASTVANDLLNGTIRLSGSFTFTGTLFQTGNFYNIPATAGVWINNPNVTISAQNDTYEIAGLLRISSGGFYAGNTNGNSIFLYSGSAMTVDGGTVTVASRIQANNGSSNQGNLSYNQSGGTVTICTVGQNTSGSIADFHMALSTDTLRMSGGTLVIRNESLSASDIIHYGYSIISGGTIQIADALTTYAAAPGFEIECGSAIPSLHIVKPSAYNPYLYLGEDLTVKGDITIDNGTSLDNLWDATYQYNISLTGNWTNNGTFVHNNLKTVTFNGSSAQTISGATSTQFNNLTMNNSSGGVTISGTTASIGSAGTLTLTNGFLYTSSSYTLTMNAGSAASGANNNSFVYGPLSKTGTTAFTFPVGKDAEYRPIAISSLSGSETFTAEYFHSDPNAVPYDVTLKDPSLDDIGRCEYWILNRAGSVNANVSLSWDTYSCGVTSLADLAVARWDSSLGMWKDEGNTGTTGAPDPSTGTVMSGLVSSFSPFTLASRTTGVNPLPVELLSFNAHYNASGTVDLDWSTAAELNNDYFTVERSADAGIFSAILTKDGAGTTESHHSYTANDPSPLAGVSYYRLKQTDFDGHYKYSATVAVEQEAQAFEILSAYYSAESNALEVTFSNSGTISLELYDISGRKICSLSARTEGKNGQLSLPLKELSEGIYLLKAFNGEKLIAKKIKL
jgi:hypothetical protein